METEVISSFFSHESETETVCNGRKDTRDISEDFLDLVDELNDSLDLLELPKAIECIYNPTIYARQTFEMYVKKYCNTKKNIMYFGMNPGPWGMSQTGVPFGEVNSVRDWLGIEGIINRPQNEIKNRPIQGFQCPRTEISGQRFWGLLKEICGTPDNFFRTSFVYNYLPQQWMKANGCNLTPGDFNVSEMKELFGICDPVFVKVLNLYEVKIIIAIGKFCEKRAQVAVQKYYADRRIQILYLPHPSPRAVNNNDWNRKAVECMDKQNLLQYYKNK